MLRAVPKVKDQFCGEKPQGHAKHKFFCLGLLFLIVARHNSVSFGREIVIKPIHFLIFTGDSLKNRR